MIEFLTTYIDLIALGLGVVAAIVAIWQLSLQRIEIKIGNKIESLESLASMCRNQIIDKQDIQNEYKEKIKAYYEEIKILRTKTTVSQEEIEFTYRKIVGSFCLDKNNLEYKIKEISKDNKTTEVKKIIEFYEKEINNLCYSHKQRKKEIYTLYTGLLEMNLERCKFMKHIKNDLNVESKYSIDEMERMLKKRKSDIEGNPFDGKPTLILFQHPMECYLQTYCSNSIIWDKGANIKHWKNYEKQSKHTRDLIKIKGNCIDEEGEKNTDLYFWGEWESYAKIGNNAEIEPKLYSSDEYNWSENKGKRHSTDPLVIGGDFYYYNCSQSANKILRNIPVGSILVFGDFIGNHSKENFYFDTVLVVESSQKYTKFDIEEASTDKKNGNLINGNQVNDELIEVGIKPIYHYLKNKTDDRRALYVGKPYSEKPNEPFSFFPCKIKHYSTNKTEDRFPHLNIGAIEVENKKLTNAGSGIHWRPLDVLNDWKTIKEATKKGFCFGFKTDSPEKLTGAPPTLPHHATLLENGNVTDYTDSKGNKYSNFYLKVSDSDEDDILIPLRANITSGHGSKVICKVAKINGSDELVKIGEKERRVAARISDPSGNVILLSENSNTGSSQ